MAEKIEEDKQQQELKEKLDEPELSEQEQYDEDTIYGDKVEYEVWDF